MEDRKRSIEEMFRSLLAQYVSYTKYLPKRLLDEFEKKTGKLANELMLDDILSIIKDCIRSQSRNTFLVLDGLDECQSDHKQDLLDCLDKIAGWAIPTFHVLVLGRTEFNILSDDLGEVCTEFNLSSSNEQDIDIYLAHLVQSDRDFKSYSEELKILMRDKLNERAEGM